MADDIDNDPGGGDAKPRSFLVRLVRLVVRLAIWVVGFFVFAFGGAWFWFESSSSDEVLAQKAESLLEEGLGRDVTIGDLALRPSFPAKIVAKTVRLGNEPGTEREDQASLTKVELKLSLRSLLRGRVRISDVVLVDPVFVLEILPDGDGVRTNLPKWIGPKSDGEEKPDLDVDVVEIRNGTFELIDHVNNLGVVARRIEGEVAPDLRNLDDLRLASEIEIGAVRFRASEVEFPPFHVESRVRYEDRRFLVEHFRGQGKALTLTAQGPITADGIDLEATLHAELAELRESLGLDVALAGSVDARGSVSGLYQDVGVSGTFLAEQARFDVYELRDVSGSFGRIEKGFEVKADKGAIADGTVSARYAAVFREGEPRNVLEIRHENIELESLLEVWGIRDTGVQARGTGELRMAWDDGAPEEGLSGSATLTPDPGARSAAQFPIPVSGSVLYRLEGGALRFEPLRVRSETASIELRGALGLRDETLRLEAAIDSTSFAEVDRLWTNLARAFGQEDWEPLGIEGRGTIGAKVAGAMAEPVVGLEVHADGFAFSGLNLERADGRLTYDGPRQELVFDGARFEAGSGEIVLHDRIGLRGEEIELGLRVEMHDWDAKSILEFLDLEFPVAGLATGRVEVRGLPSAGRVTFSPLEIREGDSVIKLSGETGWTPEEKGLDFDLDVGLIDVPVETVAGVLDLGSDLPLSGLTTGTVRLEGPLTDVSGAGSVTVSRGTVLGEPLDMIASDLVIHDGVVRLRNLDVRLPSGFVRGEAKVDFAQDRFGYVIDSSEIDIEKLRGYPSLRNVLTGKLVVISSGAGTLQDPEIVLDARVLDAVLLEVPVEDPGVSLYATVRNGEYSLRGSVGSTVALEGAGLFDMESTAVNGDLSVTIANIASVTQRLEKRTGITMSGSARIGITLDGYVSPIDKLVVDGSIDSIDVRFSEHTVRTEEPTRFRLRDGDLVITALRLLVDDQTFTASGSVSLSTGALDLSAEGLVGASLLAIVMPDLRATGDIAIALDIDGTIERPLVQGTAEIRRAAFRIQGLPQAFREVRATLVLAGNVIEIDSFTARLGGGTVTAGGRVELEGSAPTRIRVNMQGNDVDLRLSQGLTVEGGFDLVLAGDPGDRMLLKGEAAFSKVLYTRDLEIGTAIVDFIVSRRARVETVVQEWQSRMALDIQVSAEDAIRVRNNLARITGSGGIRLSGTLAQPVMLGRIVVDEGGIIRLNSVDYRVVNGSVNFQNPFRIDPYVDLTAEGRYQNEYEVTLVVTGTPDALQMSVASDPPIADLSILNVFGIPTATSTGTTTTHDSISSAGGSIIDSSVGSLLGSRLSFADNLRLEGLTGSEPKVTIEKSISDDIRAIVTYTMNDAGDNVEVIEWRASPLFLIQATRDSTKDTTYFINAIDISFSRRFGGQW